MSWSNPNPIVPHSAVMSDEGGGEKLDRHDAGAASFILPGPLLEAAGVPGPVRPFFMVRCEATQPHQST